MTNRASDASARITIAATTATDIASRQTDDIEARLGMSFQDRALLEAALTHRSFVNEHAGPGVRDNERLEFLGDALVDFVAADLLYRELPDEPEGRLTTLRSHLVREETLASYARELGLPALLRLGRGEAASGGRERTGLQCDAFEALVGAVFLDRGFAAAEALVMSFFSRDLPPLLARGGKDAKSLLQELTQGRWQLTPVYITISEGGPDHKKHFVIEARVDEKAWGRGEGASKADAAHAAAEEAITRILDEPG